LAVGAISLALPLISRSAGSSDQFSSTTTQVFDEKLAFDIPSQSLVTALRRYSEFTGQAVLFDDTLTLGRRSPGVRGYFDAVDALNQLLLGSGLEAKYSSNQAFTLKLAGTDERSEPGASQEPKAIADQETEAMAIQYAGRIQRPIQAALCQYSITRPGTYRLALQVWISPSGKVQSTRILSTHDPVARRERYISDALGRLTLAPPPTRLPQPITLLLLQDRALLSSPCDASLQPTH
jgi:hypothetical protein